LKKYYQWDISGKQWEKYFDSVTIGDNENWGWNKSPRLHRPEPMPEQFPEEWTTEDISRWLISSVLGEPEKVNTFFGARLTRDLMYQTTTTSTGGMYFNESSAAFDGIKHRSSFTIEDAYNQMTMICNRRNFWEQERAKVMGL